MKTLISIALVSLLFTTTGCERISWEIYSFQTKERCIESVREWNRENPNNLTGATGNTCYQNDMKLYEKDGTRFDSDGNRIPFERRYPD